MKLRMKVLAVVDGVGAVSGKAYTKVKVLVEDGQDAQTGFVFWSKGLGKPPQAGEVVMGDFGLAATEFGDLQIKLNSFAPVASASVSKAA